MTVTNVNVNEDTHYKTKFTHFENRRIQPPCPRLSFMGGLARTVLSFGTWPTNKDMECMAWQSKKITTVAQQLKLPKLGHSNWKWGTLKRIGMKKETNLRQFAL
jgi:hypothetical protein